MSVDIEIYRGDTRRHLFDLKADGQAVDVSSWSSFEMSVSADKFPNDTTNQLGTITGQLLTDGTDGTVYFVPPGTWDPGTYFYDAQAIDGNGEKITFANGKYKIIQDITKA